MHRRNAVIILIVGLGIFTGLFFILPDKDKTLINYISLIGNFLSIFGLILAYYQITSLKELSKKTQESVAKASQELQKVLSISEISKSKKLIDEIQYFLHNNNLDGALIRFKDLKETLIQTKYNQDLNKLTASRSFKTILLNTGIDINSLNDSILEKVDNIDKSLIIKNLEDTRSNLIEFENELKFNRND